MIFDILALFSIISSILVISSNNPVISVLFLICLFINISCYLILLGIGFIGLSYLIVYIGAIAILFIFVIIILNIQLDEMITIGKDYLKNIPLTLIIGTIIVYEVIIIDKGQIIIIIKDINRYILTLENGSTLIDKIGWDSMFTEWLQIQSLGYYIYTYGLLILLVTSIILILSIIGPIVLSGSNRK